MGIVGGRQEEKSGQGMREEQYQTKFPTENNYKSEIKQTNPATWRQRESNQDIQDTRSQKPTEKGKTRRFHSFPFQHLAHKGHTRSTSWSLYQSHWTRKIKTGILYCQVRRESRVSDKKESQRTSPTFGSIFAHQKRAESQTCRKPQQKDVAKRGAWVA